MYIFCLISKKGQFYGLSYETFLTGCSCVYVMSCPTLCNSVTCQAPLFMEFFRQEYWSGLPFFSSRGSFQPRDRIHISCICRQILYG